MLIPASHVLLRRKLGYNKHAVLVELVPEVSFTQRGQLAFPIRRESLDFSQVQVRVFFDVKST